jgi:superkiller protein 3
LDTCSLHCGGLALKLAILYHHAGDRDKALKVLEAVPSDDRTEGIARHEAIFYRMEGNLALAIDVLEKARGKYVFEVETEHELAQCYMEAGLHGKAIPVFESLLDRWKRNPWRIYYQMGYAYMEQNDLTKAREYFEKSLHVKRNNPASRALLAFVLNRMGDSDRARELWAKNLKSDPDNPVMWTNMGLALEKEGEYEEALEKYDRALRLNPEAHGVRINIGNVYLAMGRHGKALDAYEGALQSPKREVAAYNAFIAAQRKGDRQRAEKMTELLRREFAGALNTRRAAGEMALWKGDTTRALELLNALDEKNANDWYALARIHVARGREREADRAIGHLPDDPQWNRARKELRAQKAYFAGRYAQAYEMWDALKDTSFSVQYNMALAALKAKRYGEAMQMGRRLIGKVNARDRVDVCRLIGNAAFGLKQWDTARRWYEQLSGLDSRNPVVQYNLAVAWYNLGDIDKSWKHYQQARALDPALSNSDIEKHHAASMGEGTGSAVVVDTLDSLYN